MPALDRGLAAKRDRARLLLDMSKLLSMGSALKRAAPPKPRGGPWHWRGERSEQSGGSVPPCMLRLRQKSSAKWRRSEADLDRLLKSDRAADGYDAPSAGWVSAAGLAPT